MAKPRQAGMDFIDALPDDGERRLMFAVLIDAIRNLAHGSAGLSVRARIDWLRDRDWMRRDDPKDPFSFVSICSALGLSPGYVRRRVRQMQLADSRLHLHRYAAKAEESWDRQRRHDGIVPILRIDAARRKPSDTSPQAVIALTAAVEPARRRA